MVGFIFMWEKKKLNLCRFLIAVKHFVGGRRRDESGRGKKEPIVICVVDSLETKKKNKSGTSFF